MSNKSEIINLYKKKAALLKKYNKNYHCNPSVPHIKIIL